MKESRFFQQDLFDPKKDQNKTDQDQKIENNKNKFETEGINFFKSADGKIVAYSSMGNKIFLSEDGKKFYEVKLKSFGGTANKHKLSFENPHKGMLSELSRKDDVVTIGDETFTKIESYQPVETIKLPEVREEMYSFTLKSGERLKVTYDKYNFAYESFKLFIGDREIPINDVERFMDGGTTIIDTDEGRLFVPFDKAKKPTWDGEEITK
jgi:hypothetical protein